MLGKVFKFCKKAILQMIDWVNPPLEDLDLDAYERDFERRTQALESLLHGCGLSPESSRNMALKALLHDPNFDITSRQYANIKFVLKAKSRDRLGITQAEIESHLPQATADYNYAYAPVWADPCSGIYRYS